MAIGFSKSNLRRIPAPAQADGDGSSLVPINQDRTADLRNSMVPCRTIGDYRSEIGKLWDHARQSFLLIGRYLNDAKDRLPHGEFQHLVEREVPFGRSQAFQFRAIATMVDTGKVLEDELPSSSSIAYELSKLEPVELEDARRHGLLKGNVTRTQIRSWRREKNLASLHDVSGQARGRLREALIRRVSRLEAELGKAREELQRLDV
jgi:hypothetical protein